MQNLQATMDKLDREMFSRITSLLIDAYDREATIFVFGNGGSALTASHFACDINKGVSYGLEKRWKVMPLTDNLGSITAYANDVSYEDIFIEQLKNFLQKGDVVIGISGSGNSPNVLKAVEYANGRGAVTIGFTGYDGGKLARIAHCSLNAYIDDMQISEDIHMIISHTLMRVLSTSHLTKGAYEISKK
jgi:D-sedoheptulose 7-phosphate isomerase